MTRPDGRDRLDRVLVSLLWVALGALATLVAYLWMYRAGSDLTWDEQWSLRVYARNPLTALALYNEHNNHPLESLIKSVFFSVFGLDQPSVLRITGFLFVAAYLVIGWRIFERGRKAGSLVGATALAVMMLLTRAFSYQAMELRGYFLSILLQFFWFFLVVRETDLLRRADAEPAAPRWSWSVVVRYAIVAALLVFTLPSNVLAVPPLVILTVAAFRDRGAAFGATDARRFLQLGVTSAVFSVLCWVPIMLGQYLGLSKLHNTKGDPVADRLLAVRDEIALAVTQFAPRGMSPTVFGWGLLALIGVAVIAALKPERRLTRIGLLVMGTTLFVRVAFAAAVSYQTRVRTAFVPALAIGTFLIVHDLTAGWPRRTQVVVALALVLASFALVPNLIGESVVYRVPSDIASFLEMYTRPAARNVLIVHENLEDPLVPVGRVFGPDHVVSSARDLSARFRGEAPAARHAPGTWQRRLRDLVLPEDPVRPIDPSKVEVLVVVDDESKNSFASRWTDPVLDAIKARLPRRSEFRRAEFRILVYEG